MSVSAPVSVSVPVKSIRKPRIGSFHTDVSAPVSASVPASASASVPVKSARKPRIGSFHTDTL